mgnify:CR=1 FL=1
MKILISSCLLGEDVRYDVNNSSVAFNPNTKPLAKVIIHFQN